jgi:Recombinase
VATKQKPREAQQGDEAQQVEDKMVDSIFEAPDAEPKPKQKKVGPATQKVLDRIRAMYEDEGLGFPSIANRLNADNVKTFGGGKTWHPPVVRSICRRHGWTKGEKKQEG